MVTLSSIRQPEYTGENRCWPCTIVNLTIVAAACLAVVVAVDSPPLAVALAVVGLGAIYVRGYVVPYTPQFAPKLVAVLPWNPFHDEPAEGGSLAGGVGDGGSTDESIDGEQVLSMLVETGVIEVDPEADMVYLETTFEERWDDEMAALRSSSDEELAERVADAVPEAADESVVVTNGRRYVVLSSESGAATDEVWLRRPVAIAEVAAVCALGPTDISLEVRRRAAHSLCQFLESCPDCEESLVVRKEGGCCTTPRSGVREPRDALVCPSCRAQLTILE